MVDKHDGAEALSRVSGVPREGVMEIWEQVKENRRKLDACDGPHEFDEQTGSVLSSRKTFVCRKCGGALRASEYNWYQKGLEDGKK